MPDSSGMAISPKTPEWIQKALAQRHRDNLFRQTVVMSGPQQPKVIIDGQPYTAFCSNDYLGLANHSGLKRQLAANIDTIGIGSGASHLVNGHSLVHQKLEHDLAQWLGYERVLLFSTGYMANIGILSALAGPTRSVIEDKLNHASLIDGALLAQAPLRRYLHNDVESCARLLSQVNPHSVLVTDGVFSMDGDVAPLSQLAQLAAQYQALLMVDDAHGIGCLGKSGLGCLELTALNANKLPILMGTFGKAFGTAGAFVATSADLADYLVQFARPYIYTTAMSPIIAAATLASLNLIQSEEGFQRRQKLQDNIHYFRQRLQKLPLELMASNTAIQPIIIGASDHALQLSERLKQQGIWCTAIRPPTVAKGRARLRVTLSADHNYSDIDALVNALTCSLETGALTPNNEALHAN